MQPFAELSMVQELRDVAERLIADRTDHARTRRLRMTLPGFCDDIWSACVDLGWLGILIPEADGGTGLGLPDMAVVVRTMEKGLLGVPIVEFGVLGARALVHAPEGGERSRLLAGVVDGTVRPALLLGLADEYPKLGVTGGDRITGLADNVPAGHAATHFIVPVRVSGETALYVVDADAEGVTIDTQWRADGSPLAQVKLEIAVSNATLIATGEAAGAAFSRSLDEARIIASAALVGLSEHMLAMTVEYLKVRVQYDRVIGSYQALQHKAVDLHIQKELAVASVEHAVRATPETLDQAAIRAKARASGAALRIGREAIQLHGAIGFTEEHDLGLYVKHAIVLSAWLGSAAVQRRRYVEKGLLYK